ncbi:MAG: DNA repair protein RecN, partial [Firmicutes bacterium]|nr:DNA repair protein RecN [Bacillota bacterium]
YPSSDARARQIDMLSFQIKEIESAKIKENEEEDLIKERAKMNNFQKFSFALNSALTLLNGEESMGAITMAQLAKKEIASVAQFDSNLNEFADRLESTKIELKDIADAISCELENSQFDPFILEKTEKRIEEIRKIKKRFGGTLNEIESFLSTAGAELNRLESAEERIGELNKKLPLATAKVIKTAKELNKQRKESAKKFALAVCDNLKDLGMEKAVFSAEISFPATYEEILNSLNDKGADSVKFMISPNTGEPLKPLAKIASGGEMSRFMLALKNITAELEGINTLVFDEIDTGISGRQAKVVASKLYNISKGGRQVLAVTHLPQLASMADTHYLISKEEKSGKTLTFVKELSETESLKEIMRLSGSSDTSTAGLESAKEMKAWANGYKGIG